MGVDVPRLGEGRSLVRANVRVRHDLVVAVPVEREGVAGKVYLDRMVAELVGVEDGVQQAREGKCRHGR